MSNISLDHAARRRKFCEALGDNAVAIIPASNEQVRNRDAHYRFRQSSDLLYLTGFNEPDAVAVFLPGRQQGEFVLFCRPKNPEMEIWEGHRTGPDAAKTQYGADQAFPIDKLESTLPDLFVGRSSIYFDIGERPDWDAKIIKAMRSVQARARRGVIVPEAIHTLDRHLHALRRVKGEDEIAAMQSAATISANAHVRAMQSVRPGMFEYQLAADIHHEFEQNGCEPAYTSIVGAGKNGCVLHYIENKDVIADGDLILIDAGCEQQGYAADITRTFPANGRFSEPQKALYELVLQAQLDAIAAVQVGVEYDVPHQVAVRTITSGLKDLGLLKGDVDGLIERGLYRRFYMHNTGHWLGLDVHDVGIYRDGKSWESFQENMVITIEPGIYIHPEFCQPSEKDDGQPPVPPEFIGIGIRIEDDIRVTAQGPQVLTHEVPKTVAEIEALMAK